MVITKLVLYVILVKWDILVLQQSVPKTDGILIAPHAHLFLLILIRAFLYHHLQVVVTKVVSVVQENQAKPFKNVKLIAVAKDR